MYIVLCFVIFVGKPSLSSFAEGLYIISIGGNDFSLAFNLNASTLNFLHDTLAPMVIQSIHETVEVKQFEFVSVFFFSEHFTFQEIQLSDVEVM